MIGDIKEAFSQLLPELEWMDDITRQRAEEKVQLTLSPVLCFGFQGGIRLNISVYSGCERFNYLPTTPFIQAVAVDNKIGYPGWIMDDQKLADYLDVSNAIILQNYIILPLSVSRQSLSSHI